MTKWFWKKVVNYEKSCVLELGQKYVSLKSRNFHLYFEWQRMIAGILKLKNSKEVSCDKSSLDREFFFQNLYHDFWYVSLFLSSTIEGNFGHDVLHYQQKKTKSHFKLKVKIMLKYHHHICAVIYIMVLLQLHGHENRRTK